MPSLKDIQLRIKSVQTTQQTTRAMKMVAASKLKKAQDQIIQLRPYANKLRQILSRLIEATEGEVATPYAQVPEVKSALVVVVTSNRGLCGAFNSAIIRSAHQHIDERYAHLHQAGKLDLLCIGRKGFEYFNKRKYRIIGQANTDLFTRLNIEKVNEEAEKVMNGFLKGEWDEVYLVYNQFKNVATQIRMTEQFLPVVMQPSTASNTEPKNSGGLDYIYEPNKNEILQGLVPQILKMMFYRAVLDSNASEHGARMLAMDKASENANDLLKELRLTYNKARQAAITKEILEIVGGAEALAG